MKTIVAKTRRNTRPAHALVRERVTPFRHKQSAEKLALDVMLAKRKMRSKELTEQVGITVQNISLLKSGKVKAVRFEMLARICEALDCQPGDILQSDAPAEESEPDPDY